MHIHTYPYLLMHIDAYARISENVHAYLCCLYTWRPIHIHVDPSIFLHIHAHPVISIHTQADSGMSLHIHACPWTWAHGREGPKYISKLPIHRHRAALLVLLVATGPPHRPNCQPGHEQTTGREWADHWQTTGRQSAIRI